MNSIYLIEATSEYAEQIWQFRQEVFDYDNNSGSQFAGCLSLDEAASVEEWIHWCQLRSNEKTCGQTGVDVPSTTYFAIRKNDNRLVGIIDLRHHINHPILGAWGGQCGYTVRPSERRNGYAKEMLRLNLNNAKELGIDKLLITCHSDNTASEKTILANGGIYEKTIVVDGTEIKRYWITLNNKGG